MTDVAEKSAPYDDRTAQDAGPRVEWIEPETPQKRSRKKLWLGIGIPVVAVAAVGALAFVSTIHTAPGTSVFGADVGMQTAGSAEEAIVTHVEEMPITVSVDGTPATFTGKALGLAVDAEAAAQQAVADVPLWNVSAWNSGDVDAEMTFDTEAMHTALAAEFSGAYTDPVNAQIAFADGAYSAVPAEPGTGIDVDALATEIGAQLASDQDVQAIASGETLLAADSSAISVDASVTETPAAFTTDEAKAAVEKLNTTISEVGFTLEGDVVDEVPSDTVASWVSTTVTDDGELEVAADQAAIQQYADALPERVDQEPVDGDVVVDAAGSVSKVLTEGEDGYRVTSTDGVGEQIAGQLTSLSPANVALTGEKVAHETTERLRSSVVMKSEGRAYFYESVNGGEKELINSFPMAIGTAGYDTQVGEFTVYGQLTIQNMGSCDSEGNLVPGGKFDYCTPDVPYPTYFNGDQGFHGTYWHDNFGAGARMSHGCVNLTVSASEWVYSFLQIGSPVSVRA
ncbi:L,D-transpeptidase family protein [Microbacterium sp. G2-8]|uniref:L,D-transpeptidase family protein n=1 Tax=Microbacterium sp. G2-8 TaxID=2842454 RepID=UPI001C8A2261|nr:L,D-transpeptidase family protein [Microbacterium sp. G2-8]